MSNPTVLILPGWQNSGPAHWQSRWEALHGYTRLQQHDWMQPLRGDWITRLEEVVLEQSGDCVLVAHSLGCLLVAAWAQISRNTHRIRGALLVAPPDPQVDELRACLFSFQSVAKQPLPFASTVVASSNDAMCSLAKATQYAQAWGSKWVPYGERGHINGESCLGDWDEGHAMLNELMKLKKEN